MKKIYFLVLAFCFFNGLSAQVINFPDAKFKAKLLMADTDNYITINSYGSPFKVDANNDGEIEVSEALNVDKLELIGLGISSLSGIGNFTNLASLNCQGNELTNLDVNTLVLLKYLDCSYNQLENLTLSLNDFKDLDCSNNKLTSLNLSSLFNLNNLNCNNNNLSLLDVKGNNELISLDCGKNKISDLNLVGLSNLHSLVCSENNLTNLDISGLTSLTSIDCYNNKLTNIDLNKNINLQDLDCSKNQLTNLNLTGLSRLYLLNFFENQIEEINLTGLTELEYISFFNNKITTIDFSGSPKIISIDGGKNPIESFDFSQLPNLESLWLGYTPIHSLDLSNFKKLKGVNVSSCPNLVSVDLKNGSIEDLNYLEPELLDYFKTDFSNFSDCPKLKYICADEGELGAISQKIANYNYTDCVVGGYCSFNEGGANYTIQGNNKMDSDKNGCDVLDLPASNVKFTVSDGNETGTIITNDSGNYSIKVKEGTYTITPILENANYFSISPTSFNVTFPTDATPFIQDFCITPVAIHNDLEITLIPLEVARPGFDTKYKLIYKNKGNVVQSGTVNLTFEDIVLDLVISNPVISNQSVNNLSWNFTNLKSFETREITFTINLNGPMEIPAIVNGATLRYKATINTVDVDENTNDNTFYFDHTVVGSLDPNDKTCLEGDVITPSLIGEYVHYLIRFENIGTYKAQNIVVKDMIDLSKFDISTLVPTDASHSYITKISDGNKVEFIFENVNLPFDDANNDGYITFKIKTNSTLKVGDSFDNEANIYFDYNFPVLTNKATSKFGTTLGTQDVEFSNYFKVYPIPADEVLTISAIQNVEIQSIAVYDILGQMVIALPNFKDSSKIDVSNLSSGNYFIKIKSDNGSSSLKFIKN
jgi:Leucine-rich repeat (LRR) protein